MGGSLTLLLACQREGWAYVPALARQNRLGVEVGDFADPDLLDGDWRARLEELRPLLEQIPGERHLHGPHSDLNPGLRDRALVAFCRDRYLRSFEVAAAIGAAAVIFHTGYNPLIRAPGFDRRWVQRSAAFWRDLAEEAGRLGLQVHLENAWEPHPGLLRDLVDAVDSPVVWACLDAGHASVYSRRPLADWLATLDRRLASIHLHNNDGRTDSHDALQEGIVDYDRLLPLLLLSPRPPRLVLEVQGGRQKVEDSLLYLRRVLGL